MRAVDFTQVGWFQLFKGVDGTDENCLPLN